MGNGLTHIVDSLHPLPESQRAAALDQLLQDETVSTTLPRENSIKLTRCQVLQESSGCFRGPKLQIHSTPPHGSRTKTDGSANLAAFENS